MKLAYLARVEFWWWIEKKAGPLWHVSAIGRLHRLASHQRRRAERAFFCRFQENLYGQPMRFP